MKSTLAVFFICTILTSQILPHVSEPVETVPEEILQTDDQHSVHAHPRRHHISSGKSLRHSGKHTAGSPRTRVTLTTTQTLTVPSNPQNGKLDQVQIRCNLKYLSLYKSVKLNYFYILNRIILVILQSQGVLMAYRVNLNIFDAIFFCLVN